MRSLLIVSLLISFLTGMNAQPGTWTWMKGTNIMNTVPVHGTLMVSSPTNDPGGRYECIEWKDPNTGLFYMYGGTCINGVMGDMWRFNTVTLEWTWINGSSSAGPIPVHGTKGVPAATNTPGTRFFGTATWVDANGKFWLYGGNGFDGAGNGAVQNDLWVYDPLTNLWTWMHGDNLISSPTWPNAQYGPQGVPGPTYQPGARSEINASWSTPGYLWFFGGFGFSVSGGGQANDLWRYDISTNEWAWMHGDQLGNQVLGVYGTLGVPNPANKPGARCMYTKWKDANGDLWMFAGAYNITFQPTGFNFQNDVWRYTVATNEWTWMSGANFPNQNGIYGTQCIPSRCNRPGARAENRACWVANNGMFYTFGGFRQGMPMQVYNDLWCFDPATRMWTWVKGDNIANQPAVWGTQGVGAPGNKPPPAGGGIGWKDAAGNMWMFGGMDGGGRWGGVWKYEPDNLCAVPLITFAPTIVNACNGCNGSITANPSGGTAPYTYSWNTLPVQTTQTISNLCAGTYIVTVVDATGCNAGTDTITVTNATLSASVTGNNNICSGGSSTLTATGGGNYLWNTSATTSSITVTPTTTTTYTVTVSNGPCTSTATYTVSVSNSITASITGNNSICSGGQSTLTASGGGTYSWNTGSTTASITVNPTTTTSYTVTVTNGNCTATDTFTISVFNIPTATVTGNLNICTGGQTQLTASGGNTYSWSTGATTASILVSPTTSTTYTVTVSNGNCSSTTTTTVVVQAMQISCFSPTPTICVGDTAILQASGGTSYLWNTGDTLSGIIVSPTTTTTYTVTVTNNVCTSSATVTVTVNALPIVSITGPTQICIGSSATLTAAGASAYLWNTSATTASIIVNPIITTIYSVTGNNGACADTAMYTIVVNPLPVLTTTGGSVCLGDSIQISVSGANLYSWTPATSLSASSTANPTAFPSTTTTYTITGTDVNGCMGTATVTVIVNALPVINVTPPITSVCQSASVTLNASGATGYVWSPATSLSSSTGNSVSATPVTATTYIVTGTDVNGCSATAIATVSIDQPPFISIQGGGSICEGESITLNANGSGVLTWSTTQTGNNITVSPLQTTSYSVTTSNNCGVATATATVTVLPLPTANAGIDVTILGGDQTQLNATGGGTYQWTPPDFLSCTNCQNPIASPTSTTTYYVEVTGSNGCRATDYVIITVEDICGTEGMAWFPNAFTPDGNHLNDQYVVVGEGITEFNLMIFDRWGKMIFHTKDPLKGWTGEYEGEIVQEDVYVWIAEYKSTCSQGRLIRRTGHVSVIR